MGSNYAMLETLIAASVFSSASRTLAPNASSNPTDDNGGRETALGRRPNGVRYCSTASVR